MQNVLLMRFRLLCPRSQFSVGSARAYSKLIRERGERTASSAGTALAVRSDVGPKTTRLRLLNQGHAKQARGKEGNGTIFIDDLSATLEAQRAWNRASIIRKICGPPLPSSIKNKPHLRVEEDKQTSPDSYVVLERKPRTRNGGLLKRWPADLPQARGLRQIHGRDRAVKSNEVLEYRGAVEGIKSPWKIESRGHARRWKLERPWLACLEQGSGEGKDRLSREIHAFEEYMRLTPAEEEASKLIISDVEITLDSGSSPYSFKLLGSRSTGLATALSDFDFSVAPSREEADREEIMSHGGGKSTRAKNKGIISNLWQVQQQLRRSSSFFDVALYKGRIPIVRAKHRATGFEVQFQTRPLQLPSQVYTTVCLQENPFIRPLFIVVRHLLEIRGLTTVVDGGLGSYTVFMMVFTALKHAGTTEATASLDLGGQLLYILNFYGTANLYRYGFSANPPEKFDKKKEKRLLEESNGVQSASEFSSTGQLKTYNPQKPYLLCLKDPADDKNDLGKSAYAIKHIQETFKTIHTHILKTMSDHSHESDVEHNITTYSLLDGALRADYTAFKKHRSVVERFADPTKRHDETAR